MPLIFASYAIYLSIVKLYCFILLLIIGSFPQPFILLSLRLNHSELHLKEILNFYLNRSCHSIDSIRL